MALAWIMKEKLRDALNFRARFRMSQTCERQVRDRPASFYDWCAQNEAITELATLATTNSHWEDEIVTAIFTGVTNATSESLDRLAKLESASPRASSTPPASAAASATPAPAEPAGDHPRRRGLLTRSAGTPFAR